MHVLVDDIGDRGFELVGIDVLGVDPMQRLPIDTLRGVARGLACPQVAAETEDREQIARLPRFDPRFPEFGG